MNRRAFLTNCLLALASVPLFRAQARLIVPTPPQPLWALFIKSGPGWKRLGDITESQLNTHAKQNPGEERIAVSPPVDSVSDINPGVWHRSEDGEE